MRGLIIVSRNSTKLFIDLVDKFGTQVLRISMLLIYWQILHNTTFLSILAAMLIFLLQSIDIRNELLLSTT